MEEIKRSNAGQGFGVAGFVLGLVALVISFIPCIGMYALVPGLIALIFSVIAITQATGSNAPRGLIIAALVISILGTSIASWQFVVLKGASTGLKKFGTEFEEAFREDFGDEIRENIRKALEGIEDIDIPGELEEDTIVFDTDEMLEELERLEGERNNND